MELGMEKLILHFFVSKKTWFHKKNRLRRKEVSGETENTRRWVTLSPNTFKSQLELIWNVLQTASQSPLRYSVCSIHFLTICNSIFFHLILNSKIRFLNFFSLSFVWVLFVLIKCDRPELSFSKTHCLRAQTSSTAMAVWTLQAYLTTSQVFGPG